VARVKHRAQYHRRDNRPRLAGASPRPGVARSLGRPGGDQTMPMIRTEISDHIAVITMDSPPVNAVNQQFMEELIAAVDRLNDLDDVRVAVITGAGKCFSAGADIKGRLSMKEEPGSYWAHARRAREMSWCMIECKKPLIAARAIRGVSRRVGSAIKAETRPPAKFAFKIGCLMCREKSLSQGNNPSKSG
jgi:hypothetical protein